MLNTVILMGRLSHDPELKTITGNISVLKFSIAVQRSIKGQDGEKKVDWINCVAWRTTADFINKYFKKGDLIVLEGRIETQSYEDKQGNKRKAYTVNVSNVSFAGFSKKEEESKNEQEDTTENYIDTCDNDADLPF